MRGLSLRGARLAVPALLAVCLSALPIAGPDGTPSTAAAQARQENPHQRFLRMMSDHHEGLVQMGRQAAERAQDPQVREMARRLADKQQREQQEMLRMLRESYRETHQPMVMPKNRVQMEQLSALQGAEYDREFLELTIHHHHEGIMMIHEMRPRFTRRDIRAMATRMEEDQKREIAEMERMLGWPAQPMASESGRTGMAVRKDG